MHHINKVGRFNFDTWIPCWCTIFKVWWIPSRRWPISRLVWRRYYLQEYNYWLAIILGLWSRYHCRNCDEQSFSTIPMGDHELVNGAMAALTTTTVFPTTRASSHQICTPQIVRCCRNSPSNLIHGIMCSRGYMCDELTSFGAQSDLSQVTADNLAVFTVAYKYVRPLISSSHRSPSHPYHI